MRVCVCVCVHSADRMMELSGPSVTTVASVAWRDISLARASDVLL